VLTFIKSWFEQRQQKKQAVRHKLENEYQINQEEFMSLMNRNHQLLELAVKGPLILSDIRFQERNNNQRIDRIRRRQRALRRKLGIVA
jgi:hypothetical protein